MRRLVLSFCLAVVVGCMPQGRIATPAEMQQLGTRELAASPEAAKAAAVTALRLLGYDIVTTEPTIQTAPKLVSRAAVGGNGIAREIAESIAWQIIARPTPRGAVVTARIRGFMNGQPMDEVYYDYAVGYFDQLFGEIQHNLQPTAVGSR